MTTFLEGALTVAATAALVSGCGVLVTTRSVRVEIMALGAAMSGAMVLTLVAAR